MMLSRWSLFLATVALCLVAWPVHGRVSAIPPPASQADKAQADKASNPSSKQPPLLGRSDPDRPPARHRLAFAPEGPDRPVVVPRADRPLLLVDSVALKQRLQPAQPTLISRDEEAMPPRQDQIRAQEIRDAAKGRCSGSRRTIDHLVRRRPRGQG
ncbi:hypothetical protein G6O67_006268 [Ophiocordyceps sinensis]|uniref:Uncharacterized protein n=2 Tax=Ophiocordyceps sinensis TaxID=72228 RepID=A0A8H4PMU2_9HYPO|nr:hypothetical protein OCS_00886 [Ophiocordyceps sinensis CO18]KAF4506154.1 hypothetical protein G6O67_006268 [Ophiocordyceps sinensis]